jgi:hypothetical protein
MASLVAGRRTIATALADGLSRAMSAARTGSEVSNMLSGLNARVCSWSDRGLCRAVPPRAWFRLANGVFTAIDGSGASLTVADRSNNRGPVVGAYVVPGTPGGRTHGFLLDKGKLKTSTGQGARRPSSVASTTDARLSASSG